MHKILIVDDHPTIRFAIRLLAEREGYDVVAEAQDGVSAISLAQEYSPDVVILDLGLPRLDGLTVLERLHALSPAPKIVVFTGLPPRLFAKRSIEAGASAFVPKDENLDFLLNALKAVINGYSLLPEMIRMSARSNSETERLERLSNREFEVMRQLAKGASNNEIAESMILSSKTISTYKTRIMDKLQVGSLAELLDLANRHEMI